MSFSPVSRKAMALLILVFALGIAFGVLGVSLFNARVYGAFRRPQPPPTAAGPSRAVARMTQDLTLTPEQQTQLATILNNMQNGYDNIRQQMTPQFDQVREMGRSQIRQVLTPDQMPKFEAYLQKVDENRRKAEEERTKAQEERNKQAAH